MFQKTVAPNDELVVKLVPLLTQACAILVEEYTRYCSGQAFDIERKKDNSPVTQADYRVNHYICEALTSISTLPVLSEEGEQHARQHWSNFWMLDPLDGTKEFLHQRPQFTINLSRIQGNTTDFAVIAIPYAQILYIAPEQGSPLKYDIQQQQWFEYIAQTTAPKIAVGISQSSQKRAEYDEYLQSLAEFTDYTVYKAGSAYKFCMMLEDKVDIYPRFHPTCEWDTSAGQCLLERIGGGLVDLQQRPFLYNQRDTLLNQGFMAYKNAQMKEIAFKALVLMANKH